jgi:hypothetical protein
MTKVNKLGKGIILMHDFQKHTAEALPTLLGRLKAGGYKVVQMKAKAPLRTIAQYDAEVVKDAKLPTISSRPVSSVVQTGGISAGWCQGRKRAEAPRPCGCSVPKCAF